jgi:hypothetical protein
VGDGPDADECVQDAMLVASELVANAISADPTGAVLTIDVHRSHLRIAVEDAGVGEPQVQHPSSRQAHGRGVQIVERLSRDWGVTPTRAGKQVWADLPLPRHLTDHISCRCVAR